MDHASMGGRNSDLNGSNDANHESPKKIVKHYHKAVRKRGMFLSQRISNHCKEIRMIASFRRVTPSAAASRAEKALLDRRKLLS